MKRGELFLFIYILLSVFFISGILAQEDQEEIPTFVDEDAELKVTEGITPDSALYFVDEFFDRFADEVRVREEKVAEIRAMIDKGNIEAARESLERYKEYADNFEREVSPEQRDEARRSAAAIYNVLKSLEAQIPDENKEEFFDDIIEREERIVTAAEIASKIKELCKTLSELDPLEYSRTCKTGDNDPKWHKDLDDRLTAEQRKEAEAFFEIMSQCFETSGETCNCGDISITSFADKCSVIAPLAYACDVEDDESACDKMDAIEDEEPIEDLLPDYLRDVLRAIEDKFEDNQFDNHAPRECREAGATTRGECMNVMFRLDAPQECVDALERGEISLDNEREAREVCEGIMFDLEAPQECLDAGLTDFRECGKLMFRLNAPQECLDAGLTGEHRSDERKCREIARGEFGDSRGHGPGFGFNCQEIQNPEERLACYDGALSGAEFKRFESEPERDFQEHEFPELCQEAEAFTRESCERVMIEWGEEQRKLDEESRQRDFDNQAPYDCALLDCQEGFYCDPYTGCVQDDNVFEESTITEPTIEETTEPTQDTTTTDPTLEPEPTTNTTTDNLGTGSIDSTTGNVITGNAFLDYYYG